MFNVQFGRRARFLLQNLDSGLKAPLNNALTSESKPTVQILNTLKYLESFSIFVPDPNQPKPFFCPYVPDRALTTDVRRSNSCGKSGSSVAFGIEHA